MNTNVIVDLNIEIIENLSQTTTDGVLLTFICCSLSTIPPAILLIKIK